jgi:tRNA dimethylallyltransferase
VKSKNSIIVIAGPTASGKSDIAISLAKEINGYIINADSRQVYKDLKIGTAQPIPEYVKDGVWYMDNVRHFLYGYISLTEPFNISIYQKDVQNILDSQDGIPILVGGTGLYIDCIVHNYDLNDEDIDIKLREKLSKLSLRELQNLVPEDILKNMNESDRNNPRRLIRAVERKNILKKKDSSLKYIYFVMDIPKEELRKRIQERVDLMFENGLEQEVKELFNRYDSNLVSFNTIGYQEFRGYFKSKKTLEEVKKEILTHTIQYAKRQRTWFKRNKEAVWVKDIDTITQEAKQFITIS